MKKVSFILAAFFLCLLTVNAQEEGISIGVKGGLTIPKLTAGGDNPMSKGYNSRLAGGAGIFAEFHFSRLFSLQPAIEYSGQGGIRDGMQAIPKKNTAPLFANLPDAIKSTLPEYLYADFKSEAKFDYLMVPVLAKFGWNLGEASPFRVHVGAGPFVSFLLGAKQVMSGNSQLYIDNGGGQKIPLDNVLAQSGLPIQIGAVPFNEDSKIKDDMRKINAGVEGNVGISYNTGRHSIFLEIGGNYGFVKLQKDPVNGENRIGAATAMLGYAYQLGKL